jgi:Fic family protein
MALRKNDDPDLYARVEEKNLLRQYDLLTNCIEIGLRRGVDNFDKYVLWSLNSAATTNIAQHGGRYREQPIYVGNYIPPHFDRVPSLMDQFISDVHENWDILTGPTEMAAYALWRMNWIHPFVEGNGRTARAACYYLICLKAGRLLRGTKIVPERIRENRPAYYAALQEADRAWAAGHFDVSALSSYLDVLLADQLANR